MLSLLAAQCGGTVYPVHRLDRETGGLMVFARTRPAAAALSRSLGEMEKIYCCIVTGRPPEDRGVLRDLLFTDRARSKTFVVKRMRKGVKEAELSYETAAVSGERSLLRVALHTGRTHQIRVQFASRRIPLAGDAKYGGGPGQLALWCMALSLPHPFSGQRLSYFAPPPSEGVWAEFAGAISRFKNPFL